MVCRKSVVNAMRLSAEESPICFPGAFETGKLFAVQVELVNFGSSRVTEQQRRIRGIESEPDSIPTRLANIPRIENQF